MTQLQQVTSVRRALAKAASLVRNRIWFLAVTVIVKKCFKLLPVASTMTMERFVLYSVLTAWKVVDCQASSITAVTLAILAGITPATIDGKC